MQLFIELYLDLHLRVDFLDTGDMKLITAVIVIVALILPQFIEKKREKNRKAKRHAERLAEHNIC